MNDNLLKKNYTLFLQLAFILTIAIFTVLFYLFPNYEPDSPALPEFDNPEIVIINIPRTVQHIQKKIPRPIRPSIPVPVDELELLDEIAFDIEQDLNVPLTGVMDGPYSADDLPYMPRQILEVLPENLEEGISGEILLSLRIGKDGKVKEHKVVKNTTHSSICLDNVIKAASHSRWETIYIDKDRIEYWINKSYHFN